MPGLIALTFWMQREDTFDPFSEYVGSQFKTSNFWNFDNLYEFVIAWEKANGSFE